MVTTGPDRSVVLPALLEAYTDWSPDRSLDSSLIELLDDWRCRHRSAQHRRVGDGLVESQIAEDTASW